MQVFPDDPVGLGVGPGDVAGHLVAHGGAGEKAEGLQQLVRVAGLADQLVEINAAPVHPGRGAGLEPAQRQPQRPQAFGQGGGGVLAVRPAGIVRPAHKNFAAQVGAGGNDHALRPVVPVQTGAHPGDMAVLRQNVGHLGLFQFQAGGALQKPLHIVVIPPPVGLHPQAVHRRALAPVEHPALQIGGVRRQPHHPAQRVHLPHQVALGGAADAGVAGHVADAVQAQGEQPGARAQHRRRVGGLDAGVARADHDHVKISQMDHSCLSLTFPRRTG